MRLITTLLISTMMTAGAVNAGGVAEPAPAVVAMPAPIAETDWTGVYVGLGFGTIMYDDEGTVADDDGFQASAFAGYLYNLGDVVLGAELKYAHVTSWDDANSEDRFLSVAARAGYDLGRVLPYVSLGVGHYNSSCCDDSDTLTMLGVGADVQVADNVRVGVLYEYGYNDSFDFGFGDFELSVPTLSLRAMYNF